ncbi:MAG: hypothetical protein HKO59_05075, partial [Phycisphaerales bacterium]|nr:hypothetical protein [Phycisphaerales bacterium]
ALAAGRAQPIAWLETTVDFGGVYSPLEAAGLQARVEALVAATGRSWETLGDEVDAVTLCLNAPSRIRTAPDTWLATTDHLGRTGAGDRERWAWFGQVPGQPARAAYAAMCAMFITPRSAWLFDGYPVETPYTTWDATTAAEPLRERGIEITLFDNPDANLRTWRMAASRPIDAGLVFVNTHGDRGDFNLHPGRASAGDVPILNVPAAVYMVHSWSAANLASRRTVGGRWLERGVFAYFGSVQEPYLQSFVPTPVVTARLAAGYPWGAAVRLEPSPPWKLATVGDPLFTGLPRPPRVDEPLPLVGAEPLEATLRRELAQKSFAVVVDTLAMLGRDDEAAQLAIALLRDRPEQYTPDVARRSILPLFRSGRGMEIPAAVERIGFSHRRDRRLLDAMWLFAAPRLAAFDGATLDTFARHLRPDQVAVDALDLAPVLRQRVGPAAARDLLTSAMSKESSRRGRRNLERALRSR